MQYGSLKGEKIGENICGRGVGKSVRGGGALFMGVNHLGDARRASLRDKG